MGQIIVYSAKTLIIILLLDIAIYADSNLGAL